MANIEIKAPSAIDPSHLNKVLEVCESIVGKFEGKFALDFDVSLEIGEIGILAQACVRDAFGDVYGSDLRKISIQLYKDFRFSCVYLFFEGFMLAVPSSGDVSMVLDPEPHTVPALFGKLKSRVSAEDCRYSPKLEFFSDLSFHLRKYEESA